MARTVNPPVEPTITIVSDVTGNEMEIAESKAPAPVKITVDGIADGKAFKKTFSVDMLPSEWEAFQTFAADPAESPLSALFKVTRPNGTGGGKHADARIQAIRTWAKSQGIEIAERGRISPDIKAKYDAEKPEGYIAESA
jgi:hypothetical protein